jgi:hypothetical protein
MQADGKIAPPGLFKLCRFCQSEKSPSTAKTELQNSGSKVQQVSLFASVPLSGEEWTRLESGELLAIRDGRVIMEENSSGDRETCHQATALLSAPE